MQTESKGAEKHRRYLELGVGNFSLRIHRRALLVVAAVLLLSVVVAIVALSLGDYGLSFFETARAAFGMSEDRLANFFVQRQRLPRVLVALAVGAALGASGALFQNFSGNPLGSPDIMGFTVGAATGALIQIIIFDAASMTVALGAIVGGCATALCIYLLAWRGGVTGVRLVLVGIGVSATLQAVNTLLIVRASLNSAQQAAQWQAGSLNASSWANVAFLAVGLAALLPCALALSRPLDVLTSGVELATGLGVKVQRTQALIVLVGVLLVAVAVAVAGPISFVALAAPHLARRLAGTGMTLVAASAAMGGLIVVASDMAAQRLFAPVQLPVGIVTGLIGGAYLIWLLSKEWKKAQ